MALTLVTAAKVRSVVLVDEVLDDCACRREQEREFPYFFRRLDWRNSGSALWPVNEGLGKADPTQPVVMTMVRSLQSDSTIHS